MSLFVRLLCSCLLALAFGPAAAGGVVLQDGASDQDAWPAATLLTDAPAAGEWKTVLARLDRFAVPDVPHANLGVRRAPFWLHVTLDVPAGAKSRWLLDIDYPSLDRIDAYLVADGALRQHTLLGDALPYAQRESRHRSHAVLLDLAPGARHELLLRIETTSTAIVPLKLRRDDAFEEREAKVQLGQGLMAGIGLSLLLYSLVHWSRQRERLFLDYALNVAGTTLFFIAYYGIGPQHLWPHSAWLTLNAAPLVVLLALTGTFNFMRHALDVAPLSRSLSTAMVAGAWVSLAGAGAFATGLVDYRFAHVLATMLGPLPMVLGLPAAWLRLRRGDRSAIYMMVGWGGYGVAVAIMAGLLRGYLPSNFWTQHAFQFGSMFEFVMWQFVLAHRAERFREVAVHARGERDAYEALAQTDPLTGLYNRRGLMTRVGQRLATIDGHGPLALYLIDLDGFKAVNDELGHEAGDALLHAVSQRLSGLLRSTDVVARLGGDEFVVVSEPLADHADAARFGHKLLSGFDAPFVIEGRSFAIGLTIGYAMAPADGASAETLLKRADIAMYQGKRDGKHCVRRYDAAAATADLALPGAAPREARQTAAAHSA